MIQPTIFIGKVHRQRNAYFSRTRSAIDASSVPKPVLEPILKPALKLIRKPVRKQSRRCREASATSRFPTPLHRWALTLLALLSLNASVAWADTDDLASAASESPAIATRTVEAASSAKQASTMIAPAAGSDTAAPVPASEPAPTVVAAFGNAVDADHLEGERGGAEAAAALPVSTIFANGTVSDNRAVDVVTGSNAIRDGAFANASGLPIVIQNTGANVLIQNATIVNVQLH